MKKMSFSVFVFLIVFTSIIASGLAIEEKIKIEVNPENITTDTENMITFMINIINNQEQEDKISVEVSGPHPYWIIPYKSFVTLDANSSKEVGVNLYPRGDRGTFTYNVEASSDTNPEISDIANIKIDIPPVVIVKSISAAESDGALNIDLELDSLRFLSTEIILEIKNKAGQIVSTQILPVNIRKGLNEISETINLPDLTAESYTLRAKIKANDEEGITSFDIEPIHNITQSMKTISTPMYKEVTIYVHNRGNVIEKNYELFQTTEPGSFVTGLITAPSGCFDDEKGRTCRYSIDRLEPGATARISYRIEYWPTYVEIAAAIIIIVVVVVFFFLRATKPTIKKRYIKKGGNIHNIILEIKNPFLHHMKNVIIRDWISPLASVIREEFGVLKPVLKKSEAGTELIWKLGDIKPKEHRFLNYKIKTAVQGSFKMPRASARFLTPKGKKYRIFSQSIVIE